MAFSFGAASGAAKPGLGFAPSAGATAPAIGGFGSTAATAGGFGAKPPGTGGFGSVAPATGGFGAATPATGGFGAGASAAGGFGAKPPGTGGFGTGVGFGSPSAGLGTAGPATAPMGFGGGFSSGLGGGFGAGLGRAPTTANPALPTAQQYPYKGVKGPGNTTSWSQSVDFSQVSDSAVFESLPPPLQQHLLELRSFMGQEQAAAADVQAYLNDKSDASGTHRGLQRRFTQLKGGANAVQTLSVRCDRRNREAERFTQSLDSFESDIRQCQQQVLGPLLEQRRSQTSGGLAQAGGRIGSGAAQPTRQLFLSLVSQLEGQIQRIAEQLHELELDLLPGTNGRASTLAASSVALLAASQQRGAVALRDPAADASMGLASTAAGGKSAQINLALANELATLKNLSFWAAWLHHRSDAARQLFTRQYGPAEADVLFSATLERASYGRSSASTRRAITDMSTVALALPPLPQTGAPGPSVGFGQPSATAPVSSALTGWGLGGTATATTGTGFGAGFGATPAAATTGFGFPTATAAATTAPSAVGLGTGAPATTPASAPATGFGAGFATTPAPAGAAAPAASPPATSGGFSFGAAAPAAPAAGPAAAPSAGAPAAGFSLSATAPRLGGGKTGTADSEDRPDTRARR